MKNRKWALHDDHLLLHSLNKLSKSDKMQDLPSILSLYRNEFNTLKKTGTHIKDFVDHRS